MTIRSVGFRLGTEGKADVVNDFKEVGQAGKSAMDEVADAAEESATRSSKAVDEFTQRQRDSFQKQATAAKLAAAKAGTNATFDQALSAPGNGSQFATVNLDRSTGAAKQSASVFSEAFAVQDQEEAAAARATADAEALASRAESERAANLVKLRAALDPLSVAQARYGNEVATADELLRAGAISTTEHASALKLFGDRLEEARRGLDGTAKADAEAEAAAIRLRAAVDPLGAAQARYDAQLASHADLLARGKISEAEHAAAVTLSARALADAKRELGEHTNALSLNRTQTMIAQSAGMRFFDMILAGQSPIRALALESHKLGEVLTFDDGGVAGGMAKVRALATPMNLAIGAGALLAVAASVSALEYGQSLAKLDAVSRGAGATLGLTGTQLEASAESAAHAGQLTVAAARDIETGYLAVAKSGDVLTGLTAATKDYAAATGQDLKGAQSELASSFTDPIQGAENLAEKYGLLTQAQVDHIAQLVEEGRQEQAQVEMLNAIRNGFAGAAEQAEGLAGSWERIKIKADEAWVSAGRFFNTYGKDILNGVSDSFALPRIDDLAGASSDGAKSGNRANAAAEKARANAARLAGSYQGDNRDAIQTTIGTLRAGIAAGGSADQLKDWTTALAANEHALQTWVPAQQKANDVAAAQAKLAAARGPAAKAAAERALVLAQSQGTVATSADIMAQAHSRADAAAAHATRTGNKHAETLAREAASMEVNAKAALTVADAYLQGSAVGIVAEARRKAATDATRKGIDVDAQARRQLNLQIAEGAATGAKSVATLNDETEARAKINAAIAGGTLSIDDLTTAISDQNALRPVVALHDAAEGDAKAKLATIIDAYTAALKRSHDEEARTTLDKGITDATRKAADLRAQIDDLAHSPLDQALNAAARAANDRLDSSVGTAGDPKLRKQFVDANVSVAQSTFEAGRAKSVKDVLDGQRDSLVLSQRELELAGANDNYRTVELDKLKAALAYRRAYGDAGKADLDRELAGIAAQDEINQRLKITAAAIGEVREFGGKFVDDVLSTDTWSSWGNAGKTILKDIENEFIKLSLLNPLKNLINGNSDLPGLGSLFKGVTSLLGGTSSLTSTINTQVGADLDAANASFASSIGHNATGTESWSGGMTYVNENGAEIMDLPGGTRIYPAAESRRMMQAANEGGGGHTIIVHADGAVLTDTVRSWVAEGIDIASTKGAAGGAAIGEAQTLAKQKRQLGRRW